MSEPRIVPEDCSMWISINLQSVPPSPLLLLLLLLLPLQQEHAVHGRGPRCQR